MIIFSISVNDNSILPVLNSQAQNHGIILESSLTSRPPLGSNPESDHLHCHLLSLSITIISVLDYGISGLPVSVLGLLLTGLVLFNPSHIRWRLVSKHSNGSPLPSEWKQSPCNDLAWSHTPLPFCSHPLQSSPHHSVRSSHTGLQTPRPTPASWLSPSLLSRLCSNVTVSVRLSLIAQFENHNLLP